MKYKQGDLIKAFKEDEVSGIIHQIHCQGGGFGGFAGKLLQEFPGYIHTNKIPPGFCFVKGGIFSISAQIYPGYCTEYDPYEKRLEYLEEGINYLIKTLPIVNIFPIGVPLIGSGLGADRKLKGDMTDLEYFKKYIAPTLDKFNLDLIAYYL